MPKFITMKKLVFLLLGIGFIAACSSGGSDDEATTKPDSFNRTALLTNWADNIIIPSYEGYQQQIVALENAATAFTNMPTDATLAAVRIAWLDAYKAYQYVAIYNFGKADEIHLVSSSNTYPTDAAGIESNISTGTYNLSLLSQYVKQGFPAVDYLLNGLGTDDTMLLSFYTTSASATKYKKYLNDVIAKLKENNAIVLNDWKTGYRDAYVKNSGTSVTSAVSTTTNAFVKNFEKDIRTGKVGFPAGKFSNGTKFPEKVEAFYKNDVSKILLNTALQASRDFFNGKQYKSETVGASLKSFLEYVKAERDGQLLGTTIDKQYDAIFSSNSALSDSFSNQVTADNSKMLMAYDVMQKQVIYTKLDMTQALNITIDYVDGDGD